MSDEEKDLLEPDFGNLDDLTDFVDLSDLGDLENANNMDIFGDLGDLSDLGDIPDLSGTMELSDALTEDIGLSGAGTGTVPDIEIPDTGAGAAPDIDPLDAGIGEIDIPDLGDMDAAEDILDLSDMELSDSGDGGILDFTDMDLSEAGSDDALAMSDAGMSDFGLSNLESEDIPDLDDIGLLDVTETDIPDLDAIESAFDASEAAADLDLADSDEMVSDATDTLADLSDFSDIGMSNLGDIDGIPVLSDVDMAEAGQGGAADFDMTDTMDMGGEDLSGFDEMADAADDIMSMEEPVMSDGMDTNSEFSITEDGLLGDLDINFDDMASVEPEPAPEPEPSGSSGSSGGSSIDSMLDGLLDNLDMTGSLDSRAVNEPSGDASTADMLGLDGDSFQDLDSGDGDMLDATMLPPEQEKEKKPGFFKRIFGNVVTDEIAEAERKATEQEAEEAEKKAEEAQKTAEEKAAAKEQKKAEKAAQAEAKKKEKEEKKAQKAAEKAEKKAQEEAEAAEVEIVGKLNKVGVSIVAICTVLFLVCEIMGTNFFNYARIKKEASNYFEMGKYTEAYKSAIGTDMKEKDSEEYEKIRTVMRVQQAINAYQNYARVKYYPEALDALLRGLKRYDANIEQGIALEVDKDMMSCRKQILSILQTEFKMSESDAYAIISLDKPQYQNKVIKLGVKKARS